MKKSNLVCAIAFLATFLISCSDDNQEPKQPLGDYENGYFVSNEGPFQNGSGTISFVGDNGAVSQNVYKTVNGEDLGNIVNSMYISDDKAYIVVNNSNKIVVVNRFTMKKEAVILGENIINPRFFVADSGKGFISNWGDPFNTEDDFITVIDLQTNAILEKIPVGEGPERMLIDGQKLFVCLQGGYGSNNKVVVINIADNSIDTALTTGDVPNSIVADSNGAVWVLCGGIPAWTGSETPGSLYKIDPTSYRLEIKEFASTEHPSLLNTDKGNLYFALDGNVYGMNTNEVELPTNAIEGLGGQFYTMNVKDGELFATDAGDFSSEGTLKVFNLISGDLLQTITTGIVPGQVVFP
ncbi:DUF5074 domain-containing protein [Lutimonas vermicola]|uniref:DUF5074 domain-containing protein n=1 Tax=Lutimonas vermicola TaxID=414288 RepID=A0ABU9L1A5_9FLAO